MPLSNSQSEAATKISTWFKSKVRNQCFIMGGLAGTGKTHILPEVVSMLGAKKTAYAAFAAKAALVMRSRGMEATTIHSLIYHPVIKVVQGKKIVRFVKRKVLDHDLIVVDEASMVSWNIHKDLTSFGKPILYVGDWFQLPPVDDKFNLMTDDYIDHRLTEIHRQALDNPIIRLSMDIREGRSIPMLDTEVIRKVAALDPAEYMEANQVITGRNITRHKINKMMRGVLGYDAAPLPQRGEKLVFLKNNYVLGVFNGMQAVTTDDAKPMGKDSMLVNCLETGLDIHDLLEARELELHCSNYCLLHDPPDDWGKLEHVPVDFGFCLSCHKAQGSEWEHVLVHDDLLYASWSKELRARFLYTAVTRSKSKLTWVVPHQ